MGLKKFFSIFAPRIKTLISETPILMTNLQNNFCIGLLIVLASSCTQQDLIVDNIKSNTVSSAQLRSSEQAKEIALQVSSILYPESRHDERTINSTPIVYGAEKSRSHNADTLLYFVNYDDNKGFAIIPAQENAIPCIGIVEQGTFTIDDTDLPGFSDFIADACIVLENSEHTVTTPSAIVKREIKHVTEWEYRIKNGPYINVAWGQSGIEGAYCPNHTA